MFFIFYSTIMAKLFLEIGENNKILRTISTPIQLHELHKYRSLEKDMVKYIKNPKNRWVWLAAPQIGINKRLIVVSLLNDYQDDSYRTIAMINPEILSHSQETSIDEEWCLSLPGVHGNVRRYDQIKVQFIDIFWKKYILDLVGLSARVVQHEVDHIDGILFIDKLEGNSFTK